MFHISQFSFCTTEAVDQDAMDATCLLVQAFKLTLQGHLPAGWSPLCYWDEQHHSFVLAPHSPLPCHSSFQRQLAG